MACDNSGVFAATRLSHTRVRGGKHLTKIAREEKSSRGTILRILRTAPFTPLECAGIIGPTKTGENRNYRGERFTEDSSGPKPTPIRR